MQVRSQILAKNKYRGYNCSWCDMLLLDNLQNWALISAQGLYIILKLQRKANLAKY